MKKTITLILAFLLLCFGLSACTDLKNNNDDNDGDGGNENSSPTTAANILVPYFSCTGNTEKIAEMIARETVGALHEIQPQIPYTEADLDYYSGGRADREQADPAAPPRNRKQRGKYAGLRCDFSRLPYLARTGAENHIHLFGKL